MFDFDSDDDEYASEVPRMRLALRIRGDTLDPDFLTQRLGVLPTASAQKGDERDDGRSGDTGEWLYRVDAPVGTELGECIEMLLAPLPDDTTLWEELTSTYTADVCCAMHLEARDQRTTVGAEVLQRLGRLGLSLGFEIHADDGEGDDD